MDTILDYFLNTDLIDSATFTGAGYSVAVAEGLIPMFFAITVVWDILMRTLGTIDGDRPQYFSKRELIRVGTMMLLAGPVYMGLFWGIATMADNINKATRPSASLMLAGQQDFSNMLQQQIPVAADTVMGPNQPIIPAPGDPGPTTSVPPQSGSFMDILSGSFNVFLFMVSGMGALTLILVTIVKGVVLMFSIVMSKIFFEIGPLVMAFSMLPMFKDKLANWFGVYLNVLFVPLTCNLLDVIIYSNIRSTFQGNGNTSPMVQVTFNTVMIICYCMAYWLTSFYVGSSGAARLLTTAVSSASTVVTGGMSMLTKMGAAAAASKAKAGSNLVENATGGK